MPEYKVRNDLSEFGNTTEIVSIEILNKKSKNVLISTCYRPPGHKVKSFKKHIAHIIDKASKEKKKILLVGDFNINSLDYSINSNVKTLLTLCSVKESYH